MRQVHQIVVEQHVAALLCHADLGEIAKTLGLAHVLEGGVRKSGKQLRVTVQLIRVANGYHVWSDTFDRKLDDIFKVQDAIANSVADALSASTSGLPKSAGTADSEAYTLYLQTRAIFRRRTEADYRTANDYLQRALRLDPTFASAWAEAAKVRVRQHFENRLPRAQSGAEARSNALQALRIDPALAEAHLSMGRVLFQVDWDWVGAEELHRTLQVEGSTPPSKGERIAGGSWFFWRDTWRCRRFLSIVLP
jgi:tetratricopeptide (TPR) repeat protein